ncbi:Z1 domain-containing protein [Streptomyces sp. NPDC085995]|uniref:Z1 domain-containing protein n=1 Tax=Streptomyces sp. NPDC085995 TaxID=3154861 RepID=UPI00341C6E79
MSATPEESLAKAKRLVRGFLPQDRQPGPEEVHTAVNMIYGMLVGQGEELDRAQLTKEIEELVAVFQERSLGLADEKGHEPWLPEAKNDRTWDFWERYRWFLEDVEELPLSVVRRLDQSTDDVLGQLEDPRRPGPWRRKGLVIGQVQSGKTGQYIGLAAKAVDAGYQLIVVLAGVHNDLRSQTQLRIDQGLLGFNTQHQMSSNEGKSRAIGAGLMPLQGRKLEIASPTNSSETGDFGKGAAATINFPLGRFPVVLVVKKHWKILEYLRRWVIDVQGNENENGRKIVRDVPLLVIDDEADNASINTVRDPDDDPTRTNHAIRDLVNSFDRAAYVGYTATPFANIYIDPDIEHEKAGEDLFPESFVRSLQSPSNYLGPERVFGLEVDDEAETDVPPLPLVRHVQDSEEWLPSKHRAADGPVGDLPASLRTAMASFVLSCAARRARGQKKVHNSMLVHVTRFQAVQKLVAEQVEDHLRLLVDSLQDRHGQGPATLAELRKLWESDFAPTTEHFPADEAVRLTWEEVSAELLDAIRKIQVKVVNGSSQDALDYYDNRAKGLSVITVGGQKLSRGLTLSGLTVSYYLRWANTYDTLLQMGRWFGYRPGYEDMCRLYTTPAVEAAYVEVTAAIDELRREVEEMSTLGLTPRQFGLKVRSSSLGLMVTAANKMRQSQKVLLSYSGEGPETVIFSLAERTLRRNVQCLEELVRALDETAKAGQPVPSGTVTWEGVPPEIISEFVGAYETDPMAQRVRPRLISKYIDDCARQGELTDWTVCLAGRASGAPRSFDIGGHSVGMITRAALNPDTMWQERRYSIRRVVSPEDEKAGLNEPQIEAALRATVKAARKKEGKADPKRPSGSYLRRQRSPQQGLLLIYPIALDKGENQPLEWPVVGFQVSFPFSRNQEKTEYVANTVYLNEDIYGQDDEDEA